MRDIIGLLVLAAEMLPCAYLVPQGSVPFHIWVVVYVAVATIAFFLWRHEKSPQEPVGWLWLAFGLFIFGMVSFACDVVIGFRPGKSILQSFLNAGSPFGCITTICIGTGAAISIAGSARCYRK